MPHAHSSSSIRRLSIDAEEEEEEERLELVPRNSQQQSHHHHHHHHHPPAASPHSSNSSTPLPVTSIDSPNQRRATFSSLSSHLIRRVLILLPPASVARVCCVSTHYALLARTDVVWSSVLKYLWRTRHYDPELKARVVAAIRQQRRESCDLTRASLPSAAPSPQTQRSSSNAADCPTLSSISPPPLSSPLSGNGNSCTPPLDTAPATPTLNSQKFSSSSNTNNIPRSRVSTNNLSQLQHQNSISSSMRNALAPRPIESAVFVHHIAVSPRSLHSAVNGAIGASSSASSSASPVAHSAAYTPSASSSAMLSELNEYPTPSSMTMLQSNEYPNTNAANDLESRRSSSNATPDDTLHMHVHRFTALPNSLKSIYQAEIVGLYKRFEYIDDLNQALTVPLIIRAVVTVCSVISFTIWILMYMFAGSEEYSVDGRALRGGDIVLVGTDGEGDLPSFESRSIAFYHSTLYYLLHPSFLSLLSTTSFLISISLITYNMIRIMILSQIAKNGIWKRSGRHRGFQDVHRASDADYPEFSAFSSSEAASDGSSSQSSHHHHHHRNSDKHWWRTHLVNRWYSIRYQVWIPPQYSFLLLYLTGVGLYLGLWCFISLLCLKLLNITLALLTTLILPCLTLVITFQLGRMLFLSRFIHIFLTIMISCTQFFTIYYLIHTKNMILLYLLEHSLVYGGVYIVAAFTPNLLLVFSLLWISDQYLMLGWMPVILPFRLHHNQNVDVVEEEERDANGQPERQQQHARHANESASPSTHRVNIQSPALSSSSSSASSTPPVALIDDSLAASSSQWPILFTPDTSPSILLASTISPPAPRTFGYIIIGEWFEHRVIRKIPLRVRRYLCSRAGLCAIGGAIVYLAMATYWSQLFDLFLIPISAANGSPNAPSPQNPTFSASLTVISYLFHFLSLLQFFLLSICIIFLVIYITLSNHNWKWWWCVYGVPFTTMLGVSVHYWIWKEWTIGDRAHQAMRHGGGTHDAAHVAVTQLHRHFSHHWFHSWPTWFGIVTIIGACGLCSSLLLLVLLYQPKNIVADATEAASRREQEMEERNDATQQHQQQQQSQHHFSYPHLYDGDDTSTFPSTSPSSTSLSELTSLNGVTISPHRTPHKSQLTFFQALQQPSSPAILNDEAFQQQLRHIEELADQRVRGSSFIETQT